jgi:hypothetical protein
MAIFCEDIRVEQKETITLVGILPDHITVSNPPNASGQVSEPDPKHGMLSRLGIYVRIAFDPDLKVDEPVIFLTVPGQEATKLGVISASVVKKAKDEARARGNILAGVIFRAVAHNFQFKQLGQMKVEVELQPGKERHLAGAVNFSANDPLTSSNEKQQPS